MTERLENYEPRIISPEFQALLGRQMIEQLHAGVYESYIASMAILARIYAINAETCSINDRPWSITQSAAASSLADARNEHLLLPVLGGASILESPPRTERNLYLYRVDPETLERPEPIGLDAATVSELGEPTIWTSFFDEEQAKILAKHVESHTEFRHEFPQWVKNVGIYS